MRSEGSIRRLLLGWLLIPLALVLLAGGLATYSAALNLATDAYDRSLLDPALAIAGSVRVDEAGTHIELSPSALEALRVDSSDRLYFAVVENGRAVAGQDALPLPEVAPTVEAPVFYDAIYQGAPVRIAALAVPSAHRQVLVQVAETRVKRDRLAQHVLLAIAAVELLVIVVALGAIWIGVRRGLAPIKKLQAELAKRSHLDLRAVPASQAPEEVRPLVHELNALLARLSASIELQQRFVTDAAHQLRTPLAALLAQLEAAQGECLPPRLAATVEQLYAATRRAGHLAHQLLTLASIDPLAERPFTPQPIDLTRVVKADASRWIAEADRKRIDLGFELEPAPVRGEAALLGELAANLIDNAIKYTPSGGEVTVRTGQRGGESFLEVEDSGPGIPEAERERVFERFYRGRGSAVPGAGLGLPIVREIAHRHQGRVELASSAAGGVRIRVLFPNAANSGSVP